MRRAESTAWARSQQRRTAAAAAAIATLVMAPGRAWSSPSLAGATVGRDAPLCAAIEALPASGALGDWRAGGVTVRVRAATTIDESQGGIARGVSVVVEGSERDGVVAASRITVRAAGCGSVPLPAVASPAAASGYLAVGALGGGHAGPAGVAVALVRGDTHEVTLDVRGLQPHRPYVLLIDGTVAAKLTASESGLIHLGMSTTPARHETMLPAVLRPASSLQRVELKDTTGAAVVAGDLRPAAPRDAPARAAR